MLAAATVNPEQRKHFYLGFQAEHKLAYSGAQRRRPLHPVRVVPLSSAQVGVFVRGMAIVLFVTLKALQYVLKTLNSNSVLTAKGT